MYAYNVRGYLKTCRPSVDCYSTIIIEFLLSYGLGYFLVSMLDIANTKWWWRVWLVPSWVDFQNICKLLLLQQQRDCSLNLQMYNFLFIIKMIEMSVCSLFYVA